MKTVQQVLFALFLMLNTVLQVHAGEFHTVASIGYDDGGDTIADISIIPVSNNQTDVTEKIKAGKGLTASAGLYVPIIDSIGLQATAGWKIDSVSAQDLNVNFTRIPFDFLVYMHFSSHHSLAGGMTYHTSVSSRCSTTNPANVGCNSTVNYNNATGVIGEYNYAVYESNEGGIKLGLRYTQIEYSHPVYGAFDGSSVGVILYAY